MMPRRFAGGRHTLTLFKAFHYQGHYCIVTELLGTSLYLALKKVKILPGGKDEGFASEVG